MVFSSLVFIYLFLPFTLLGYMLFSRKIQEANVWLFISSFLFYWIGGGVTDTILLLVCVFINYLFALLIDKNKQEKIKKIYLFLIIAFDVLYMCFFKYTAFVLRSILCIFPDSYNLNIILPIGISFYTFQAISYVIDVYRGENALKSPIDLGLYISFFPQLIAGPIIRFCDFAKELDDRQAIMSDKILGLKRFVFGLSKKVLIANILGELADLVFGYDIYSNVSSGFVWLGVVSYALQIYYDFSGYSDMAIGLARIFGFHFKENFAYPYTANSVTDFWRKWHISLSSWFRDYVYIPLGGSRRNKVRNIVNLGVVWLLTGIWHGANWTFLFWGLGYFILLLIEKYVIRPDRFRSILIKTIYRIFSLMMIIILWVVFRSNSMKQAISMLSVMFGINRYTFIDTALQFNLSNYFIPLILGIIFSIPIYPTVYCRVEKSKKSVKWLLVFIEDLILIALFFVDVSYLLAGSYNPFIYFMF